MTEQHEHEPEQYTVVVGVSPTTKSPTALMWAHAQAQANRGRMVAVRAYQTAKVPGGPSGASLHVPQDADTLHQESLSQLQQDVSEVLGPDHGVELHVVRGGKRGALLEEARGADLLVIDAPRKPSMSPLLAHRIVYAATCPVVVMPPSIAGAPESALHKSARALGRAALRSAGTSGRPGYRPPLIPDDD